MQLECTLSWLLCMWPSTPDAAHPGCHWPCRDPETQHDEMHTRASFPSRWKRHLQSCRGWQEEALPHSRATMCPPILPVSA